MRYTLKVSFSLYENLNFLQSPTKMVHCRNLSSRSGGRGDVTCTDHNSAFVVITLLRYYFLLQLGKEIYKQNKHRVNKKCIYVQTIILYNAFIPKTRVHKIIFRKKKHPLPLIIQSRPPRILLTLSFFYTHIPPLFFLYFFFFTLAILLE